MSNLYKNYNYTSSNLRLQSRYNLLCMSVKNSFFLILTVTANRFVSLLHSVRLSTRWDYHFVVSNTKQKHLVLGQHGGSVS